MKIEKDIPPVSKHPLVVGCPYTAYCQHPVFELIKELPRENTWKKRRAIHKALNKLFNQKNIPEKIRGALFTHALIHLSGIPQVRDLVLRAHCNGGSLYAHGGAALCNAAMCPDIRSLQYLIKCMLVEYDHPEGYHIPPHDRNSLIIRKCDSCLEKESQSYEMKSFGFNQMVDCASHHAARAGNISALKILYPLFRHRHDLAYSPLGGACLAGQLESVKFLIEHKASVNQKVQRVIEDGKIDDKIETPLSLSLEHPAVREYLLDHGAEVDDRTIEKVTLERDIPLAIELLKKDSSLRVKKGFSVLFSDEAAIGHLKNLRLLWPHIKESELPLDILHKVCIAKQWEIIKFLIEECHININQLILFEGKKQTPLSLALEKNQEASAQYLIEHGASLVVGDPIIKNASLALNLLSVKNSPLFCRTLERTLAQTFSEAVQKGDLERLIKTWGYLHALNFKPSPSDLHAACKNGYLGCVKQLIEVCNISADSSVIIDEKEESPLSTAIKYKQEKVIDCLLSHLRQIDQPSIDEVLAQKNPWLASKLVDRFPSPKLRKSLEPLLKKL